MQIVISPSDKPSNKFEARIDGNKSIHFGAKGYEDFTIHKDTERRERYLQRHRGMGEDWNNPLTAAFYATNILWNKPTITESIKDTNRRFKNISIMFKG